MERNSQVKQSKIEFGISKPQSLITCKKCGCSGILYGVLLPVEEYENPMIQEQGTWSYCPFCGTKNKYPIG
jgi:hypothetical protein